MLVCHCLAVNDRTILEQIEQGALDVGEMARRCGAGSQCGSCVQSILGIIESEAAVSVSAASTV